MTINTTPRFGLRVWSDDADAFARADFATSLNNLESLAARMDSGLAADRPAAAIARRLHFATDTEELALDTGAAWKSVAGTPWATYAGALTGGYVAGVGGTVVTKWRRDGLRGNVEVKGRVLLGAGFTMGTGFGITLPSGVDPASGEINTGVVFTDTGTNSYRGIGVLEADALIAWTQNATGGRVAPSLTVPFAMVAGDLVDFYAAFEPTP